MIFEGEPTGMVDNFTMDLDPGYRYVEKFRCGFQWFMMESRHFILKILSKLKNEYESLVSFNGQLTTFRVSIEED